MWNEHTRSLFKSIHKLIIKKREIITAYSGAEEVEKEQKKRMKVYVTKWKNEEKNERGKVPK